VTSGGYEYFLYLITTIVPDTRQTDFCTRIQDSIDNTQTHNIYTVLHGEMIIYYQKHQNIPAIFL
jgi:hypothetical protein